MAESLDDLDEYWVVSVNRQNGEATTTGPHPAETAYIVKQGVEMFAHDALFVTVVGKR